MSTKRTNAAPALTASEAAAALGRLGGQAKTAAKVAASRANGRKGGRPRKRPIEKK